MAFFSKKTTVNDILILTAITVVIGACMIGTTVVISRDGVLYIERAQQLQHDYRHIMNLREPFGFPVLIASFHSLFSRIVTNDSPQLWCLSAQVCVLMCRILAVVVLYILAKILVDQRTAFRGVLVLIVLPYPAEFGVDVLREWPHLLFLFAGLLFLYNGIQRTNGIYLFLAGLVSGLGSIIRPECAQVVLYALAFLVYKTLTGIIEKTPVRKYCIYFWAALGFAVIFLPYAVHLDEIVPYKLHELFQGAPPAHSAYTPVLSESACRITAVQGVSPIGLTAGFWQILQRTTENLMYYFALPAGIGFCLFFFTPNRKTDAHLLVGLFVGFYVAILCLLYAHWGYISRRHVLPLAALLCLYVPNGLNWIGCQLAHRNKDNLGNPGIWFNILLAIGILICLPKLSKPIGHDKKAYRQAAHWIAENTKPDDRFYTFDSRIPFYADRKYRLYKNKIRANFKADYLITQSKSGYTEGPIPTNFELQKTLPLHSTDREILIFKHRLK